MEIKRPDNIRKGAIIFGYSFDAYQQSCMALKADYPDKDSFEKEFLFEVSLEIESNTVLDEYVISTGMYTFIESKEQLEDMQENYLWSFLDLEVGASYWAECPYDYRCEAYEHPAWIAEFRVKEKEDEE